MSVKCVLNSQAFGIRSLQIVSLLQIAIELEMGLYLWRRDFDLKKEQELSAKF